MKHIIQNFQTISGHHCITTALRHIFTYHDHSFSEEMLFGLGSGLGFFYGEYKTSPVPFIGFRCNISDFENQLADSLKITLNIHTTSSRKKALSNLKELISQDLPVMVYVDMAFLKYLKLPDDAHFGGHGIVVFGIDEEEGVAYVSDRDDPNFMITGSDDEIPAHFHKVPLEELESARASTYKPFPPKNKWLTCDFTNITTLGPDVIFQAIRQNAEEMINPPIKNLGVKGIQTCSERVKKWRGFEDEKLKWSAFNAFISINQIGGTGGGGFRKMYGNFLRESGKLTGLPELKQIGDEYWSIGDEWDRIGKLFYTVHKTLERNVLKPISEQMHALHEQEATLMNRLLRLCSP